MPNRRSLLFLMLAVVFGFAAMLLTRAYLANATVAPAKAELRLVEVAVAARDLTAGVAISVEDVRLEQWPAVHAPASAFETAEALAGRVVRLPVGSGDPIFASTLLPEGSAAGLIAMIESGHRAVSVKVDAVVGVAGFVKPGTRVDVLATLRRDDNTRFSQVVLQDVKVLAVDQTLEEANGGEPDVVNVVTLEVKPLEAKRLIHSAHEGRLQLALRHPGDEEVLKTKAVRAGDIYGATAKPKPKPRARKAKVQRDFIELIKGTERSKSELSNTK